jgi:Glycosyl hydrolases family 16
MTFDEILADGYVLDREDSFEGDELDTTLWLPNHLPQWSSGSVSAARYQLAGGNLNLLIEKDQGPWCPEFDGLTRVSSLQTGVFAGPVGSAIGQHRFSPAAVVREGQINRRLYTPQFGAFALRARASDDPDCMVAMWMIGYEDQPENSGELCVCEIFGKDVRPDSALVGIGVHPFSDPALRDDFEMVRVPIDVTEFHEYGVEWAPEKATIFVDGESVRSLDQSPQYPMQFMLGIYQFEEPGTSSGEYPKRFTVDWFRAYRPI